MIKKMSKIQVVGPRTMMVEVLDKIYNLGQVHIDKATYSMLGAKDESDLSLKEVQLNSNELKEIAELGELVERINPMLDYLKDEVSNANLSGDDSEDVKLSSTISNKSTQEMSALTNKIESQLNDIKAKRESLKKTHGNVVDFGKIIETFVSLMGEAHKVEHLEMMGFSVSKQPGILERVKNKLKELTNNEFEIFVADLDRKTIAVLIAAAHDKIEKIHGLFSVEGVKELSLPAEYVGKPFRELLETLKEKKGVIPDEVNEVNDELKEFANRYYGLLKKIQQKAKDAMTIYGEVPNFVATKFTFVLNGWMPKDGVGEFKKKLEEAYGTNVVVEEMGIKEEEYGKVPVVLENNSYSKRFQLCLSLFKPPRYGGVDPTLFLSIFFPFIFGMILGDMAYGAIILLLSLFIRKKAKTQAVSDVGFMMMTCAISTIIWGFLYGEVMGTLGHYLGLRPIIVNREDIPGMMSPLILTVGFGAFHILLALGIKVVDSYKHHNRINAHVVEAAAIMNIIFMAIGMIMSKIGHFPESIFWPCVIILVISWVAVFICGGIGAGLEIFGVFGNILSYARIMAIGMQSVIMAMVANIIAAKSPVAALGIGICVLVHIINIILGLVGPVIHGLRLHFVETFSKFVKLEGSTYQPFTKEGGE